MRTSTVSRGSGLMAAVALLGPCIAGAQDGHGSIVAWGRNVEGQCNVPAPNSAFVGVAGSGHSLGLKADGSIVAGCAQGRANVFRCTAPWHKGSVGTLSETRRDTSGRYPPAWCHECCVELASGARLTAADLARVASPILCRPVD